MNWIAKRWKITLLAAVLCLAIFVVLLYGWNNQTHGSVHVRQTIIPDAEILYKQVATPEVQIPEPDKPAALPEEQVPQPVEQVAPSELEAETHEVHRVSQRCVVQKDKKRLPQEVINGIEKFTFFIGWPHSGHTIVASLMDAHPNMVIANVFNVHRTTIKTRSKQLKNELFTGLYRRSQYDAKVAGLRSKKGYDQLVEGSCQGSFTELKVIGVKAGGIATNTYEKSIPEFHTMYKKLSGSLQMPVKVIHVIRNPYDMIATHALYEQFGLKWKDDPSLVTVDNKLDNSNLLNKAVDFVFTKTRNVQRMIDDPQLHLSVLEIHGADLIHHTRETIERLCLFLDVECPVDYLDACEKKVYADASKTRDLVKWTPFIRAKVEKLSKMYMFFLRYSLDSD